MADDHFGFLDAGVPKSLTPPAGYEGVHVDGMTWGRQGDRLSNTSWIAVHQWNHLIAQFRGLLTIDGIDLSDVEPSSPLLLKMALLRSLAAALSGEDVESYGLMKKSVFDPQGRATDVFARGNHTGTQAISTVSGLQSALNAKADSSRLNNAGLAGNVVIISNANDAPMGAFSYVTGTEEQSVEANLPALGGASSTPRAWVIITAGSPTRRMQIAQEIFGSGTFKGRVFRRQLHETTWGPWLEFATVDKVLALAGGTLTGDLRLDGGIGIGMDPPQVGGLYFYRQNGNPFIVFLGDANSTGSPVQLAQIRAEQTSNVLRLVNAGLSTMVSFNLTTRLGEVAGNPTTPLGIATKQYVDALGFGAVRAYQDVMTGTASTTSTSFTDTGLEISGITLPSASHGLLLSAPIALGASTSGMSVALVFTDGANNILAQAGAAGTRSIGALGRSASANFETGSVFGGLNELAWYPGSAGPHTVKLRWKVSNGTGYLNRSGNDSDNASNIRLASGLTAFVLAPQA